MKEYLSINTSRWIYTSNKTFALTWRRSLSYRNQSIDLLRRSMGWFLYDRDLRHELRRSSSIILQNSALTSCKAEFAFCFLGFFFYLDFLSQIFTIHRIAREGGSYLFIFFQPLPLASPTLAGSLLRRAHLSVSSRSGGLAGWRPDLCFVFS